MDIDYIIFSVYRCRSTLLSYLLDSTGLVGSPFEFYGQWSEVDKGITIMPGTFHWIEDIDFHSKKLIWLRHDNFLIQAISFLRAYTTKKWGYDFKSSISVDPISVDPIVYSEEQIDDLIVYLLKCDLKWKRFFLENQLNPLEIFYCDMETEAKQLQTVKKVIAYLGVYDDVFDLPSFKHTIQSDEWNQDVYDSYLGTGVL